MCLLSSLSFLALSVAISAAATDGEDSLLVNAIVSRDNISFAECWKVEPGFQISNVTGTVGDQVLALGNMSNALLIIIPEGDGTPNDGGLHNGAHAQWVFALTGGATVDFPEHPGRFSIGAGGIFISTDIIGTSRLGHHTLWDAGSHFIQAPFPDGVPVGHTVVAETSCDEFLAMAGKEEE
ncbi:MFS transporter [Mycena kentingensis (nom. inval.)]|nr:MFS transporter [Mycena kentingensis (nom. inval.)]